MYRILVLILYSSSLLAQNGQIYTWYVSQIAAIGGTSPSDSNSGRDPDHPFLTISKALSVVQSGQSIGLECHSGPWQNSTPSIAVINLAIGDIALNGVTLG